MQSRSSLDQVHHTNIPPRKSHTLEDISPVTVVFMYREKPIDPLFHSTAPAPPGEGKPLIGFIEGMIDRQCQLPNDVG